MPDPIIVQSLPLDVTCELGLGLVPNIFTGGGLDVRTELKGTQLAGIVPKYLPFDVITQLSGVGWLIPTNREFWECSKIGDAFDFTKDDSHESVRMPTEHPGWIYQAKQLNEKMVMYGENGVTVLSPRDQYWSSRMILNVGLKGKNAIAGNQGRHVCVDKTNILWDFSSEGLIPHDYSQFLSLLGNCLVISYDERLKSFYISDANYTFIYNQYGLGKGPIAISGMGYRYGIFYVVSPSTLTTAPFEICTDIHDLGNRDRKEIMSMKFGTDVTQDLYVAIDYRWNKAQTWFTTPWVKTDRFGVASIRISGIEFRFRAKLKTYAFMKLDYIEIDGFVEGQADNE